MHTHMTPQQNASAQLPHTYSTLTLVFLETANIIIHAVFVGYLAHEIDNKIVVDTFFWSSTRTFLYNNDKECIVQLNASNEDSYSNLPCAADYCQLNAITEKYSNAGEYKWNSTSTHTRINPVNYKIESSEDVANVMTLVFAVGTALASAYRLFHYFISTDQCLLVRKIPTIPAVVSNGYPKFRHYVEYFFTAPIMLVTISILAGVHDVQLLVLYAVCLAAIIALGAAIDAISYAQLSIQRNGPAANTTEYTQLANAERGNMNGYGIRGVPQELKMQDFNTVTARMLHWTSLVLFVASVVLYGILMSLVHEHYLVQFADLAAFNECTTNALKPPDFLRGLFLSQMIIFSSFAAPFVLILAFRNIPDIRSPNYEKYRTYSIRIEIFFVVLSVLAKASLCYYSYTASKMRIK